jgi:hypothetical protein
MRVASAVLGMMIGVGGAVGITLSQAETKMVQGQPRQVVATVTRGRAHETQVVKRCLWVGIPAGLVGAGIGYLATSGAHLGGAFLGAMILSALSSSWRADWAERFGRAGEHAQVSDMFLHGLLGGLFGAAAAAYWRNPKERPPARPQQPELAPMLSGERDGRSPLSEVSVRRSS